ncbi:MAG: 7-carboxy-7-deazaguanine synthase QueE [Bacteroidetes bacterium]|nr:MAG: 7-carboxy-7-deazaguanine synthase QueE [Bacteroidota bacterium]
MSKQNSEARYPLMEHYYTIQGEGYNTGKAAYFIRLGGCDVGCVWCDVKDSWDASKHPKHSVNSLLSMVEDAGAKRVVVTGGEPAMYDLEPITTLFSTKGKELFIETSGAYPISGAWDWICVSPKKFKAPLTSELKKANELKVIVFNQSDFDWALEHAKSVGPDCKLFLQPEYSVQHRVLPGIIDFVKLNPDWQISLQTHKVMQIP